MKKPLLLALAAAAVLASSLSARTVYVPSPDTDGRGGPRSVLLVTNRDNVTRPLAITFIPTGQTGNGRPSRTFHVPGGRSLALDMRQFTNGTGMLRLVSVTQLEASAGAFYVESGSQNGVWSLPMVSGLNRFRADRTAFLPGLSRSAALTANVEVMNLSNQPAHCTVDLEDRNGTAILPGTTLDLPGLSHAVAEDVLGEAGIQEIEGATGKVSCDKPFYAYGTLVGASPLLFRMVHPLALPPQVFVDTVTLDRPGTFFRPVAGNSELDLTVPLVPGLAYRRATIEFDMFVDDFTPIFTGILGMFHTGGPRFNRTLYFGTFIRGNRDRSFLDLGIPVVEAAIKRNTPWKEHTTYRVKIVYDTEAQTILWQAFEGGAGGRLVLNIQGGIFNLDLADRGNPVRLNFGLDGVADNAYFPPIDWRFSNLKVRFMR